MQTATFPKAAVEDMTKMGQEARGGHLPWQSVSKGIRKLITSKPGYLGRQFEEDIRTAASNLYPQEWPAFRREIFASTKRLVGEDFATRYKGAKPNEIVDALFGTKDKYPLANATFANIRSELLGGPEVVDECSQREQAMLVGLVELRCHRRRPDVPPPGAGLLLPTSVTNR